MARASSSTISIFMLKQSLLTVCAVIVYLITLTESQQVQVPSRSYECFKCMYYRYGSYSLPEEQKCIGLQNKTVTKTVLCQSPDVCRLKYFHDNSGQIVQVDRQCAPIQYNTTHGTVLHNNKIAMYCNTTGCNNNWKGTSSSKGGTLMCYSGIATHIDNFKLHECKKREDVPDLKPECMLAQLTREIMKNGKRYEATLFLAGCSQRLVSLYGSNYPFYEYEYECYDDTCNSGHAGTNIRTVASSSAPSFLVSNWTLSYGILLVAFQLMYLYTINS